MDTFFEQLVPIRKNAKTIIAMLAIWILALIICAFLFIFPILGSINILLMFGVCYGAFKLSTMMNIEYEYIITNGILDIDKITNKSSRKRILTIDLRQVTRLETYSPTSILNTAKKSLTVACNEQNNEALLLVCEAEGKSTVYLVFAPDERLRSAMAKYVPKFIGNSILK